MVTDRIFRLILVVFFSMMFAVSCRNSSSSGSGGSGGVSGEGDDEGLNPSGTVTISGTLSGESTNVSANSPFKARAVENYVAQLLNSRTGEQKTTTVGADGSFSFSATGSDRYMVNFFNSQYRFVGTLATDEVGDNGTVSVGLITGDNASTTDLGTVTAAVDENGDFTGRVTSDATINTDSNQLAYTSGGTIAGGNTGDGSTNYADQVGLSCDTAGAADCADYDFDGVPDITDTDNNNDGYSDEVSGVSDYCTAGTLLLYIENYPTSGSVAQTGFPTPDEVAADIGGTTMYQIHLELTPASGTDLSDISSVSVTTPSYIDSHGYVYHVASGHECFNTLWTECSVDGVSYAKKLMPSDDGTKFEMALADINLARAGILENMFPGDTFIFNVAMEDGTEHVCTRKINIIPKYYPYAFKYNGTMVDTDEIRQTWDATSFTLSWSKPVPPGPPGMTYQARFIPFQRTTGNNCTWSATTYTTVSAGQGGTEVAVTVSDLPASDVNYWSVALYAIDDIGDISHTTAVRLTTDVNICQ